MSPGESGHGTLLLLILIPAANLLLTYVHWWVASSGLGYFSFASYVLDYRGKFLSSNADEVALYDLATVRRARIQCVIVTTLIFAAVLIYENWPPCRVLYGCQASRW